MKSLSRTAFVQSRCWISNSIEIHMISV